MAHEEKDRTQTDRRTFLQAGALAAASASAASLSGSASAQEKDAAAPKSPEIPTRVLGKTGVKVTMLEQGAVRSPSLNALLRQSFANGVRVFDTAKVYGSEPNFKRWFEQAPEVRKQIFLVTKDMPRRPSDMIRMLDQRLETLGTDYIDLFFMHGFGDDPMTLDQAVNWVKSQEFKETAEKIRKSGKAKFIGFSCHHRNRAQILEATAEGNIVDAIMIQYTPWLDKDAPLNKAIDACSKKNIGIMTMKHMAGQFWHDPNRKSPAEILKDVERRVPVLRERNLTPFQGFLHAIWTDERVSTSCVSMRNTDQLRENADAARRFEPLKTADILQLRDAALAHGPMLCADCDGRCMAAAGTKAELGNLTRFLTYHEHHGLRADARRQYAELSPEARDWSDADLAAAQAACPNRLNFAKLLPEVDRHLA